MQLYFLNLYKANKAGSLRWPDSWGNGWGQISLSDDSRSMLFRQKKRGLYGAA